MEPLEPSVSDILADSLSFEAAMKVEEVTFQDIHKSCQEIKTESKEADTTSLASKSVKNLSQIDLSENNGREVEAVSKNNN